MPKFARLVCAAAVCAVVSVLPTTAWAGDPTLMIDRLEDQPITVDRAEFAPKDPEWLRTLALHVKNTSAKQINYVEFSVSLSGIDGDTVDYTLRFGVADTPHQTDPKLVINPDKMAKIQWTGDDYKGLKKALASGHIFYPAAAVFRLHTVGFADGSTWKDRR